MSIIEVQITKEIVQRAKEKAATVGVIQGSITGSTAHVVGAIGEVIVQDYIDGIEASTKDYDLIKGDYRIDVKTKRCNTVPEDEYECSVASHGTKQKCDKYVFVRLMNDYKTAWILGEVTKEDYFSMATRHKRGEVDPSNGFIFKADCYNLQIGKLNNVQKC